MSFRPVALNMTSHRWPSDPGVASILSTDPSLFVFKTRPLPYLANSLGHYRLPLESFHVSSRSRFRIPFAL